MTDAFHVAQTTVLQCSRGNTIASIYFHGWTALVKQHCTVYMLHADTR